eukprot:COSAG02_NODE_6503_length_3534_cov_2.486463_4_plen_63_part_00
MYTRKTPPGSVSVGRWVGLESLAALHWQGSSRTSLGCCYWWVAALLAGLLRARGCCYCVRAL